MFPDDPNAEPLSSFQRPFALPTSDPNVGPLVSVCFAAEWQPYVIGCLFQLLQQTTWDTPPGPALDTVQQQAFMLIDLFQGGCVPTGQITMFAGDTAPEGWLFCDGTTYLKSAYPDLYGVLDAAFIVDATHFITPDLRSRVPVGIGTGSGLSTYVMGQQTGDEAVTLTTAEMPAHTHVDAGHQHTESGAAPSIGAAITGVPVPSAVPTPSITGTGTASIQSSGGGGSHTNIQPVLGLNFIIKT